LFFFGPLYCFGYAKDQGSIRNRMALHQWESTLSRPGGDAHEDFPWRIQLAPAILRRTTLKARSRSGKLHLARAKNERM
jgi:hypothetical protein